MPAKELFDAIPDSPQTDFSGVALDPRKARPKDDGSLSSKKPRSSRTNTKGSEQTKYHSKPSASNVVDSDVGPRTNSADSTGDIPAQYADGTQEPSTAYYNTIPLVPERLDNGRWDATELKVLRERLDSGTLSTEETDKIATDFEDDEIIGLASDWLGNTVYVLRI